MAAKTYCGLVPNDHLGANRIAFAGAPEQRSGNRSLDCLLVRRMFRRTCKKRRELFVVSEPVVPGKPRMAKRPAWDRLPT